MTSGRDESTFVELINQHRAVIERIARVYSNQSEDRRELAQEIVYQLWRAYPTFRGASSPLTWIYRVAINTAITAVRKRRRRPEHVPLEGQLDPAAPATGPFSTDPRLELLYRAIAKLNDVERALMTCFLDDLSYKGIAEVLGITETAVGVRLTRVKAKLQALINELE